MSIDEKAEICVAGFPKRLEEALAAKGLKKSELAQELNCSWGTVGTWAKGRKTPSSYYLIRLSDALCVTTDWLLGLSEDGGPARKEDAA